MVSAYQQFVKDHIHQFKHLPAKERMGAVAQLYKKGSEAPKDPVKKGRGRPKKGGSLDEKGGNIFDDLVPLGKMAEIVSDNLGGGLKKGRGRPKKGGSIVESPLMSGDSGAGMTGAGIHKKKGGIMTGAGLADELVNTFTSMFNLKGRGHL
jgi:hypothetical protein